MNITKINITKTKLKIHQKSSLTIKKNREISIPHSNLRHTHTKHLDKIMYKFLLGWLILKKRNSIQTKKKKKKNTMQDRVSLP